jgi:hypothetical protein
LLKFTDCPRWGEEDLRLNFSGLEYHLLGLTPGQRRQICDRFELSEADYVPVAQSIQVVACQADFTEEDIEKYIHPVSGYAPVVETAGSTVAVEGIGFRGAFELGGEKRAFLATRSAERLDTTFVFENFLRVISAYAAVRMGGLLLHSAGVVVNEQAYLFLGRSGAGKTTMARKALTAGAEILSDDGNLLLPEEDGGFSAGPVPFAGELGQVPQQHPRKRPVKALIWLSKGDLAGIRQLSRAQAYSRILVCAPTVNADEQQFETVDAVLEQLSVAQPCFELVSGLVDDFNSIRQMIDGAISNAVSPQ